ncbi:hypothetical protein TNCV_4937531 [Trichonephila clavipes]|nr:hypothetical protein TNCV_4937531 [Trichonephila clavipes]
MGILYSAVVGIKQDELHQKISTTQLEIKHRLKEYLTRETHLTLWKIYVIDMPLVITSFGTLLTYGMLLGTVGKTS